MDPEKWVVIALAIAFVVAVVFSLVQCKRRGDFDIGKRMRMRNEERRALATK